MNIAKEIHNNETFLFTEHERNLHRMIHHPQSMKITSIK